MNYQEMTQTAVQAALLAGQTLQEAFDRPHQIRSKEGRQNLVTEADTASEERILSFLQKAYPHHGFLAEEEGEKNIDADILWIIDPLDGTLNFARGIPHFSVSISACQGDDILLGVVLQPMTQELFIAEKGKGATLNKRPITVSSSSWEAAFLSTGFPYNVEENPLQTIEATSFFLHQGFPLRRLGSAAIDLAYVAAGRFDAYFETGIKPWDVAAGILLVQEAGGVVTRWDGTPYHVRSSSDILAASPSLHPLMVESIQKGRQSCR